MSDITHVVLSIQQLTDISNAVARKHLLQAFKELQEWKEAGRDIKNYILVKVFMITFIQN